MISTDTNLLGYAANSAAAEHPPARAFLATLDTEGAEVVLCELMLVEFYNLLRNPAVFAKPASATAAAAVVHSYRTHPRWRLVDYPGPEAQLAEPLWRAAAAPQFARRRIYDVRLALTMRHHGVTDFAPANVKDFQGFGFARVWNPLAAA